MHRAPARFAGARLAGPLVAHLLGKVTFLAELFD